MAIVWLSAVELGARGALYTFASVIIGIGLLGRISRRRRSF